MLVKANLRHSRSVSLAWLVVVLLLGYPVQAEDADHPDRDEVVTVLDDLLTTYQRSGTVPELSSPDGWHDYLSSHVILAMDSIDGRSPAEDRAHAILKAAVVQKRSLAGATAFFEMLVGTMFDDTLAPTARALLIQALPDILTIAENEQSALTALFDGFLTFLSKWDGTGTPDHRDLRKLVEITEVYQDPYLDSAIANLFAKLPDDKLCYINLGDEMDALRAGLYAGAPHNLVLYFGKGYESDLANGSGLRFDYMYWKTWGTIVDDPASILLRADRGGYARREEALTGVSKGMYDWCFQDHVEDAVTCTATAFYQHFPCLPHGRDGLKINVVGTQFYNTCRSKIHEGMKLRFRNLRQDTSH